jgi:hypothetical protein
LAYKVTGLVGSDKLTGSLTREVGENVGTYAIGQGSLANSNYNINYVGANLTITAKDITVTADAQTKTYGEADPTMTYQVTGLVGKDSLDGALVRDPGEKPGIYTINLGTLANSNYNINFIAGKFTINAVQNYVYYVPSGELDENFISTIPAIQGSLIGKSIYGFGSLHSMEYRDLISLEVKSVYLKQNAEVLPVAGSSIKLDYSVKEMTIDNISVDFNKTVSRGVSNVSNIISGREISIDDAAEKNQEFTFKTQVKLHRSMLGSFDQPEEFNVYAGNFAAKAPVLKSEFEKLLDSIMVME